MRISKSCLLVVGSILSVWIACVIGLAAVSIYMEMNYPPAQRLVHIPDRFLPVLTFTMFILGPLGLIISGTGVFLSYRLAARRIVRCALVTLNVVGILAAMLDIAWVVLLFTLPIPVPH